MVNDLYIIRFAVCAKHATDDDMHVAFHIIQEHADRVIAEYQAQRHGRKSSSNDSLDSIIKQASTKSLEREVGASVDKVFPDAPVAIISDQCHYPLSKIRVNSATCSPQRRENVSFSFPLGKHDQHDHPQPSRHFREANLESIERETSTSNVCSYGLRCEIVLS